MRLKRASYRLAFNPTAPIPELTASFKPEKLWAFEAGFKSEWLDKRLRANAAGFFSYYTDMQQSISRASPTLGLFQVAGNADRAEIWGMEVEGTAIPVRGVELTATYGFIAPKFTKWSDQAFTANNTPIFDPSGQPVLENVANTRTWRGIPRHQVTVGLTYTAPPTTSGTFSAHGDVYWQDEEDFAPTTLTAGYRPTQAWAYALVSGRLAYSGIPLAKGTLDIAVFARNLLDRKYRTYGVDIGAGLGYAVNVYGDPRTFGLQLVYNFTAS